MMKGEKMVKRSSFGTIRKRLSDITNLHSQHRSPAKEKDIAPPCGESSTKDYIQQLLKENAVMMKLIQERDKIIEITGVEMQKLRISLQKTQLQNWHLAQSNSQMLAELNLGKDRLKALQHELACKDTLFKAKILELEDKKPKTQYQTNVLKETEIPAEKEAVDHPSQLEKNKENKVPQTKKKRPARSRSMGPTTTSQQACDKEMAENKRRCLRRQSVRLRPNQEPQVDLFEVDVANFPMSHQSVDEPLHKSNSGMKENNYKEGLRGSSKDSLPQRSSLGRPLRRAAEKVQTYKEPSLSGKLRRPE